MREQHTFYRIFQYFSLYIILMLSLIGCGGGGSGQSLQAPVARAGEDSTLQVGDTLTLDGTASYDADGQIVSYLWEENSTILGKKKKITLNTLQAGSHTITLTIKDNDGLTSTDTLTVQIWPWDIIGLCTYTFGCEPWRLVGNGKGLDIIKDINPQTANANPMGWRIMAGSIYFFVANAEGFELWKMDQGADPVPQLIKSFPDNPYLYYSGWEIETAIVNGNLYFPIIDFQKMEITLWKSNGTPAGTTQVESFRNMPKHLTPVGNQLFFVLDNNKNGSEVWVTDGSNGNAHMVSIVQDDGKGDPKELTAYQGQLYFVGNDGATGDELWRTNGTPAGTVMVADINPGAGDAHTSYLTVSGNKLYFVADDGTHGSELWMYDGSQATLLKDIVPNSESSYPSDLTDVKGKLYFTADDHSHGKELWVSDGTPSGTTLYYDIVQGAESSHPRELTAVGKDIVYVAMDETYGRNLFVNKQIKTIWDTLYSTSLPPRDLLGSDTSFSFIGGEIAYGLEPYWSKDSTLNRLADIAEGPASSDPKLLGYSTTGEHLYFSADDGIHGRELWMSDGTELGTHLVKDIANYGRNSMLGVKQRIGDIYYFTTLDKSNYTGKLFRSDGTLSGTYPIKSLRNFKWMIAFKDKLFFADESYIYSTDGTKKNTLLYAPSTQLQHIPYFTGTPIVFHDKLYFVGHSKTHGEQLYCIDGVNSLERVSNFSVGDPRFANLTVMGDRFYFSANDGATHGIELWKSDGTLGGISLVKDIVSGGGSSVPKELTLFKNKLYFTATTLMNGRELWVSDGSTSGTKLLTDINTQIGVSSNPEELIVSGEHLYFTASGIQRGRELWRTDGTAAHTLPVIDIYPGSKSSSPSNLFAWEGHLIFDADDGTNGRRIWILDSDAEDPWMMDSPLSLKMPFAYLSWKTLTVLSHKLFYQIMQSDGTELWVTDGTEDGTEMLWKEQW